MTLFWVALLCLAAYHHSGWFFFLLILWCFIGSRAKFD